ncbi:TPA: hypothetical protein ACP2PR_002695 [Escherichia coli]|uniref:hypothetical protein n=1 Tax=Escherichia TaxID=561 RepID=UPI0015948F72|nr:MULTISPECIES: hypothetical protein [Escherichia]EFC1525680.1 hypothetical protein [Escherichia coli]EFC9526209.1 hypothetical protein [Escherichia coli]EGM8503065.1 hypothetical protein [Escherichia coli]EJV7176134.1 hypothetical protein [Escherichia coli]MBB2317428.1 hypothetical protein [Escherichia sp. 93.1518]
MNYRRLQEIKFEIPQEQPTVPEGVKRTYRAPDFVCKDAQLLMKMMFCSGAMKSVIRGWNTVFCYPADKNSWWRASR